MDGTDGMEPDQVGRTHPFVENLGTVSDKVGHTEEMHHAGQPDPALPDPDSVKTVADLGYQLSLLRVHTPGSPTIRELADRSGVPRATIGNAESGRHLPSRLVIDNIVRACGVPDAMVRRWLDARARAYLSRHRPQSAASVAPRPVVPEPRPGTEYRTIQLLSAMPARAAATRLTALPSDEAIEILEQMPIAVAAERLSAIGPGRTAELVAAADIHLAAQWLAAAAPNTTAAVLDVSDTDVAATLLDLMAPDVAARRLQAMRPAAAGGIVTTMNATSAAQRLTIMDRIAVRKIFYALEIGDIYDSMMEGWASLAATYRILPHLSGVLIQASNPFAVLLMVAGLRPFLFAPPKQRAISMSATAAAAWLSAMDLQSAADRIAVTSPATAAAWIAELPVTEGNALLTRMPATAAVVRLTEMDPGVAARHLLMLGGRSARQFLDQMSPSEAAPIIRVMNGAAPLRS